MKYTAIIRTPLQWLLGDKPDITGTIKADGGSPNLLGATFRLTRPYNNFDLVEERVASVSANGDFIGIVPDLFIREDSGNILISALVDSSFTATLDTAINSTDSTVEITGTAPLSGFCLIEDEWIQYSLSGTTMTMIARGLFKTTPASHAMSSAVAFSQIKETCLPYYPYKVLRSDLIPQNAV